MKIKPFKIWLAHFKWDGKRFHWREWETAKKIKKKLFAKMLSPHISRAEFACKCGCDQCYADSRLLSGLEKLRALSGEPLFILSGYRCQTHNSKIGGAPHSYHLYGKAADVRLGRPGKLSLVQMFNLAERVKEFREGGIGVYPEQVFIHVDTRNFRARWCRMRGKYEKSEAWGRANHSLIQKV